LRGAQGPADGFQRSHRALGRAAGTATLSIRIRGLHQVLIELYTKYRRKQVNFTRQTWDQEVSGGLEISPDSMTLMRAYL
jgi:hypothetical protein